MQHEPLEPAHRTATPAQRLHAPQAEPAAFASRYLKELLPRLGQRHMALQLPTSHEGPR